MALDRYSTFALLISRSWVRTFRPRIYDAFCYKVSKLVNSFISVLRRHEKARELHQKYGPVVRIAPHSVLVADKNVVKQV